jgi:hypothetical protein
MRLTTFLPVLGALGAYGDVGDDASILFKEVARTTNSSLMWGAYRPNLYFGVRPRIPNSFMGGLMWSKVDQFQDVQNSKNQPSYAMHVQAEEPKEMQTLIGYRV